MTAPAEAALERLAELCGIVPRYVDGLGQRRSVPTATRRALLSAMGIDADDDGAVAAAIDAREGRDWRRTLPPVVVIDQTDGETAVTACIPDRLAERDWHYRIDAEDGASRGGTLRPGELAALERRRVDGVQLTRYRCVLPTVECGYHRLHLEPGGGADASEARLIVVPPSCFLPETLGGEGRVWGPALAPDTLRSHRSWGAGDFADLREALAFFARAGAGSVATGPLNAVRTYAGGVYDAYLPSSRLAWNVLHVEVEAAPGFAESDAARERLSDAAFLARLAAARDSDDVDHAAVIALKLEVLGLVYAHFRAHQLAGDGDAAAAFRGFVASGGEGLHEHALHDALTEHFGDRGGAWPPGYEHPLAQGAQAFAREHAERVEFHLWLQWLAEEQLAATGRRSAELGVGVGLCADLPAAVDPAGSEAWAGNGLYAAGATVGAAPEPAFPAGRDRGGAPWVPERLVESAYQPFVDALRHNMRHAGALRLDHVLGLVRQFWIPTGAAPADGTFVRYPASDLLGILRLESQRHQCVVIGEDTDGTAVDAGLPLERIGVLLSRLFPAERRADGEWTRPEQLPRQALVAASNHEQPTLRAYWRGEDIARHEAAGLYADEAQREAQVVQRAQDRARILFALREEELLPEGMDPDPGHLPELPDELMLAVYRYLARGRPMMLLFRLDDALGADAPQAAGPAREAPPRKLRLSLEQWAQDAILGELVEALATERGVAAAAAPSPDRRDLVIPGATYRLQLNAAFTFADAAAVVPYLHRLGVSHLYLSPFLKARPGSNHGYDVIDHRSINPEVGSREDLAALAARLRDRGMGQIADMVPNHMGVMGSDNGWWLDVLENGQASPYAGYFDIDWRPVRPELRNKVLVPVLGDHYGTVLERGELALHFDADRGTLGVRYYEHSLPLDPATYGDVLGVNLDVLGNQLGEDHPDYGEFLSVLRALDHLPARQAASAGHRQERHREEQIACRRLAELCRRRPEVRSHVDTAIAVTGGVPDNPASYARLHELLERQAWRVAYWQVAADEINYRRFFDINELAALRPEEPEVFDATHELVAALYREGLIDGLRIDHPDGLYDPQAYFERLQSALAGHGAEATQREDGADAYVLVEKILAGHEHLREEWPVHGTTGYDFALLTNGLLVDTAAERELERCFRDFTGERYDFDELLYACKRLIVRVYLSSELTVLANLLNQITLADWHTRDFTLNSLRDALTEIVSCFPVYRTYVTAASTRNEDREYVDWAVAWARRRAPAINPDLYELVRSLLLLELPEDAGDDYRAMAERFAMKFQQFTAPVTAKALEDTCFYRYNRLVSLNEVGGEPRHFGISAAAFHRNNLERARRWPHAMLAASTHDNKRSEDVRARINVLSELAGEWRERVGRWRRFNRRFRRAAGDVTTPTRRDEYLYYQTLLGVWPLESPDAAALADLAERLAAYMRKAVREAKEHSGWMRPDERYEAALEEYVRATLEPGDANPFIADFDDFARRLAPFGLLNSLTQTALRLTAPGMPDLYQGNEVWDFSLVDPDNRRPVDFDHRDRLLAELERRAAGQPVSLEGLVAELMAALPDGRAKLYLTWRLLHLRGEHRPLFDRGDYLPLTVSGERADHVCAFTRRHDDTTLIVAAGRWFARLQPAGTPPLPAAWGDTALEAGDAHGAFRNVLTGAEIEVGSCDLPLAGLLSPCPVAVLVRTG